MSYSKFREELLENVTTFLSEMDAVVEDTSSVVSSKRKQVNLIADKYGMDLSSLTLS